MIFRMRSVEKYFSKHVMANSAAHLFLGVGLGLLAARPLAATHPVRWALVFIAVGLGVHIMAMTEKK